MKYRPDIDGLRALSVLAVIVYHAKIVALPGGYLGVDVFFVISGYLIASNILNQQYQNHFSLSEFYEKRARRILPLLLLVLVASSYFAWNYLLPSNLVDYASSQLSAIGFFSNIFFFFQDNYHAAASATKPLLHTWSLGVEEQFYLVFPLLLMLMARFNTRYKCWALCFLFLISLAFADFSSRYFSDLNFYMLPSRFWELLAGVLLALYNFNSSSENKFLGLSKAMLNAVSLAGLAFILSSLILFSTQYPHPSLLTLVPVLGAVLVIACGSQSKITYSLLGNRLMAWVGRLSYSLYLWHFPIFAFALIKAGEQPLSLERKLHLVALTFLLSVLSHYLIERPFRSENTIKRSWFFVSIFVVTLGLTMGSFLVIKYDGVSSRLGDMETIFEGADRNDSFLLKDGKPCYFLPWKQKSCKFELSESAKKLILVGDSHANMVSIPLLNFSKQLDFNFYNMVLSHCPYIKESWRLTGFKTQCQVDQMRKVRAYFTSIEPSIVVYVARWPMYLNSQRFDNGEGGIEYSQFLPFSPSNKARADGKAVDDLIIETFNELGEMGHKVVLVYPVPEVGWHVPQRIKKKLDGVASRPFNRRRKVFESMNITTSYQVYKDRIANTKAVLDRITHPNVLRIYPDKIFCSESTGRCSTHSKHTIFYYDDDHLSQSGSALLVERLSKLLVDKKLKTSH